MENLILERLAILEARVNAIYEYQRPYTAEELKTRVKEAMDDLVERLLSPGTI